jgi:hypothetical protein
MMKLAVGSPVVFEQFNGPARRALRLAFREARRRQHDFLGTEHLLFGLLCDHGSPSVAALRGLMQTPETIQARLEDVLHAEETGAALDQFPLSPAVQRALSFAGEEAAQFGQSIIGPEHLLLGLLREEDTQAAIVLAPFGLDLEQARRVIRAQPAAEKPDHLLQTGLRPPAGGPDPSAAELAGLVAPLVPPVLEHSDDEEPKRVDMPERPPDIASAVVADSARHAAEVENQLRKTQLVLGAVLGFYFVLSNWQLGILGALAGICLAVLRSSFAGAWMGFMAASVFLPGMLPDSDNISGKARFLFGLIGAFVGSFLGDFWRRPHPPAEMAQPRHDDGEDHV